MYCSLLGNDTIEEDIDIVGNEAPVSSFPPVEIEKDTEHRSSKCVLSGSFSGNSSCLHCFLSLLAFHIPYLSFLLLLFFFYLFG